LSRRRGLARLEKRRAWLQQLHDVHRVYYGWLLGGVLWVLAGLGMLLALEGSATPAVTLAPEQQHFQQVSLGIGRFAMGFAVYTMAFSRLLQDWYLRRDFDRMMARMDRAIARLEAKQALQPPAAAA
jgi:hypothetical protein